MKNKSKTKKTIAENIKEVLVKMAVNDSLPLDMTQLDESRFDKALFPIKQAISRIMTVRKSCEEGADGSWDCSTDEGKEGFNDMITLLDEALERLK